MKEAAKSLSLEKDAHSYNTFRQLITRGRNIILRRMQKAMLQTEDGNYPVITVSISMTYLWVKAMFIPKFNRLN